MVASILRKVGKECSIWSNVYSGNFHHLVLVMRSVFMIDGSQGIPTGMRQGIRDVFLPLLRRGLHYQGKLENAENITMCPCWPFIIKPMCQKSVHTWRQSKSLLPPKNWLNAKGDFCNSNPEQVAVG